MILKGIDISLSQITIKKLQSTYDQNPTFRPNLYYISFSPSSPQENILKFI